MQHLVLIAIYLAGSASLTVAVNWLALRKWRRANAANWHWSQRARLLWPVRVSAASSIIWLPLELVALQYFIDREFSIWCVWAGLASWFGSFFGTYPLDREMRPALTFRQWLRIGVLSWSLRIANIALWAGGWRLMPEEFNGWCFIVAAGFVATVFFLNWRLWRKLLGRIHVLVPANDRLQTIADAAAHRMRVSVAHVFLLDVPMAGAWALPFSRDLIFSTRLMDICDDNEVDAICAHELAHLTESKGVLYLRLLGSLVWFPVLFMRPLVHAFGAGAVVVLALTLGASPLLRRMGRRMEKRADSVAAEQQQASGVYARALEKLYQDNQVPAVNAGSVRIHPSLYDRMLAAGIQPDFERPKPPESISSLHFLLGLSIGLLVAWFLASAQN